MDTVRAEPGQKESFVRKRERVRERKAWMWSEGGGRDRISKPECNGLRSSCIVVLRVRVLFFTYSSAADWNIDTHVGAGMPDGLFSYQKIPILKHFGRRLNGLLLRFPQFWYVFPRKIWQP
jgi:hypothetical protein